MYIPEESIVYNNHMCQILLMYKIKVAAPGFSILFLNAFKIFHLWKRVRFDTRCINGGYHHNEYITLADQNKRRGLCRLIYNQL